MAAMKAMTPLIPRWIVCVTAYSQLPGFLPGFLPRRPFFFGAAFISVTLLT
jgi:hypothetical protein